MFLPILALSFRGIGERDSEMRIVIANQLPHIS
jgi:hypothetical protein